jgi:RND family efflux transporter MFP subunit
MSDHVPSEAIDTAAPMPGGRGAQRIPLLIGAIAFAVLIVVLAVRYHRPDPPTELRAPGMTVGSNGVTLSESAPQWSVIKLATPKPATSQWSDATPGRIVFDETRASRLGSPLAGRVTAVMVERGQHVKSGAPLYTIASPGLAELRAEREKAIVERTTARANLDRTQALVDAQSLPGKELVTAKQQLAETELAVRLAEQKINSLRVTGSGEASFTVSAPRDGVVVEKNIAVGQEVDASSGTVMAIADLASVWVVADLFENDAGSIHQGTRTKVSVGNSEFEGSVDQVSAVVDPERHTIPVRVKLANPDGVLRPNAYAQIRFFNPTPAQMTLPASAVLSDGARNYVYVKDHSALVRRDISIGTPSGGDVPVLSGLEPHDQVVIQGAILLDNQIQLDN